MMPDNSVQAIKYHFDQIRGRITPEAHKVWKQAELAMSTYGNQLPAS
jgi:hypothetical protein